MTQRPRVAIFLPTLEEGGAERVMVNLAGGLVARGFAIDFVLARAKGPYVTQVPAAARVIDFNTARVLGSLRPLARYLDRERPVAVLAVLEHAALVAMAAARVARAKPRVVISIQNTIGKSLQDACGLKERSIPWLLGRFHRWFAREDCRTRWRCLGFSTIPMRAWRAPGYSSSRRTGRGCRQSSLKASRSAPRSWRPIAKADHARF